jgi:hypothetical protein
MGEEGKGRAHLCGEVLEDGGEVDGRAGADALRVLAGLEEARERARGSMSAANLRCFWRPRGDVGLGSVWAFWFWRLRGLLGWAFGPTSSATINSTESVLRTSFRYTDLHTKIPVQQQQHRLKSTPPTTKTADFRCTSSIPN